MRQYCQNCGEYAEPYATVGEYVLCSLKCAYEYGDCNDVLLDELISVKRMQAAGTEDCADVEGVWNLTFAGGIERQELIKKKKVSNSMQGMTREARKEFKKARKRKARLKRNPTKV